MSAPSLFQATTAAHVVRQVVFEGADPNERDGDADTPLLAAVKRRAPVAVVRELTRLGACGEVFTREGLSALFLSVSHPDPAVLEHFLALGVDANGLRGRPSPLQPAAYYGYPERIDTLVAAGADPNHRGPAGRTPLFSARTLPCVQRLLAAGANPHLRTWDGLALEDYWREQGRGLSLSDLAPARPRLRLVSNGH